MSLVKKFATVGGATLGSRVLGFARETLMAAALGTGPMADAFYAAFRFPKIRSTRSTQASQAGPSNKWNAAVGPCNSPFVS